MELVTEKLKASSKTMAVFMKIGQIGCIVGFCIAAVTLIWLLTFKSTEPVTIFKAAGYHVTINVPVGNVEDYSVRDLITLMSVGLVQLALYYFAFRNGHRLFNGIYETGEPFRAEYAELIRRVAWQMVACAIVWVAGVNVVGILVSAENVETSFPMGHVICAVMLLCFSRIFQYGAELQRLSDETL